MYPRMTSWLFVVTFSGRRDGQVEGRERGRASRSPGRSIAFRGGGRRKEHKESSFRFVVRERGSMLTYFENPSSFWKSFFRFPCCACLSALSLCLVFFFGFFRPSFCSCPLFSFHHFRGAMQPAPLEGLEASWHMDKPGRARGLRCSVPSFRPADTESSARARTKAMILTVGVWCEYSACRLHAA